MEFEAFQQVHNALVDLDDDARARVVASVSTLLGIGVPVALAKSEMPPMEREDADSEVGDEEPQGQEFGEFAELYAAATPATNADRALVAGYWLQECQGAENFTAQTVNNELKHLGHKLSNVTDSLTKLISAKPNLVLQLRKSGKSRQARKTYKLSTEGIKRVMEMIHAT